MTFDEAFERLIGHEGGYVSAARAYANKDPGGETKFGVSKRSYPMINIELLTLDQAKVLYKQDFWGPAGCDAVPDGVKFDLFDMAVNSGLKPAARTLQRAVGAEPDGIIGPKTIMAVQSMHPARVVARFNGHRLEYMAGLKNWDANSEGWAKRIAANLQSA